MKTSLLRGAATAILMALPSGSLAASELEPIRVLDDEPQASDADGPEGGKRPNLWKTIRDGRSWLLFNYRFEFVDDRGLPGSGIRGNAYASTLRSVLGYETDAFYGFKGLLEFENVSVIGNDLYNSTVNGRIDRPVVPDPAGTEVNRARLRYGGVEGLDIGIGRRNIILDNQRFISTVGWRQNYQTYDALAAEYGGLDDAKLFYAYVGNVNRVVGEENPNGNARMRSHLLNGSYVFAPQLKAVGYWYYLDSQNLAAFSTNTVGARLTGDFAQDGPVGFSYQAEAAYQRDATNNPNRVSQPYGHGVVSAKFKPVTATVGYEMLGGGGGGNRFTTPLALLHGFNGWADKFLVTPPDGLRDLYVMAKGKIASDDTTWIARVHGFWGDRGGRRYGNELDALLTHRYSKELLVGVKAAFFDAQDPGFSSATKLWFWTTISI